MERRIQIASVVTVTLLIVSTVFAWVTTQQTINATSHLDEALEIKYESYLLADELRQSSDDLTRLARTYVVTGKDKYEKQYFDVLAIRNGEKARPVDYHGIYWDLVAAGTNIPPNSNRTVPLLTLMKEIGFTDEEFEKLDEAVANSDHLVAMEVEAMNAIKGLYADASGAYTIERAPNRQLARQLLHSDEYHSEKAKIMTPVSEFYVIMENRLNDAVITATNKRNKAIERQNIAFIMMSLITVIMGVFLILFCIRPLRMLTNAMTDLADGKTETEVPCQKTKNEFGVLARHIAAYKANSDKIAELGEAERESKRRAMEQREAAMALQAEVEKTVTAAMDGDFTSRIEMDVSDEASRNISDRMNALMGRLDEATAEIVRALTDLGNGKVDQPLSLDGGGRFQEMEQTGDDARTRLGELIGKMSENAEKERMNNAQIRKQQEVSAQLQKEIDEIISDAQEGRFDKRIELAGADENATRIAEGMNHLMSGYDQTIEELISQFTALGQGDLTRELHLNSHGRFGELKDTANRTQTLLIDLIDNVSTSAESLQSAVNRLRADANTVSGSMQNQAASIEETSAATTEMTKAIKENAVSLSGASELANTVDQSAVGGSETMSAVVTAVEEIKNRSDKIAEIVSIIENISFQTNLLALNATVEAARAGEAGRGFAVVASEVRNLSLRASDAATDIASLINATTESVDEGVVLAHKAGTALGAISDDIGKLREKISTVSASGRDQALTFQEVEQAINEISNTTQTTAASAERSAELSDSLVDTATALRETLGRFQTPQTNKAKTVAAA